MTKEVALWLFVVLQALFAGGTLLLLLLTRGRRWSDRKINEHAARLLAEPTRRVVLGEGSVAEIAAALRRLPTDVAAQNLIQLGGAQLPSAAGDELARVVRRDEWIERALEKAHSRLWWRRLDAARLLAVVASEADAPAVEALLLDPHAAVVIAVTPALGRIAQPRLIAAVLDTLHRRPAAVRAQQGMALRRQWTLTEPLLAARLRGATDVGRARAWITLADALDSPLCLTEVLRFASHPAVEVRITAARALAKCFHPDAVPALRQMLRDNDWRIRVQAARSLGSLGAHVAIDELAAAMRDESWWVRFRAALALAAFGEPGRAMLGRLTKSPDEFASDMATFIHGLPEGMRIELSAR